MEHSVNYAKVKSYYDRGLWNLARVKKAVEKGWITEEEYQEITGQPYDGAFHDLENNRYPEPEPEVTENEQE